LNIPLSLEVVRRKGQSIKHITREDLVKILGEGIFEGIE
jgi:hypothetical protein